MRNVLQNRHLRVSVILLALLQLWVCSKTVRRLKHGKHQIAMIQIKGIEGALQLFFMDSGRYPDSTEGLASLIKKPGNLATWKGPYLDKAEVPSDPWGNPYHYRYPGDHGEYDIFSFGPDEKEGGEGENADITSWKIGARSK